MIQPLAYVHPDAKIAKNVVIEPFTTISKNVEIGEGTWIGPNVTIMEGARIGKNCRIFPGAVISAIPQDLKYKGEETTTHIGDNTTIRECVTINKGTADRMKTVVGNNCLIMAYSHVAHDCIIGEGCIFSNSTTLAGHVTIGDFVVMAGSKLNRVAQKRLQCRKNTRNTRYIPCAFSEETHHFARFGIYRSRNGGYRRAR